MSAKVIRLDLARAEKASKGADKVPAEDAPRTQRKPGAFGRFPYTWRKVNRP